MSEADDAYDRGLEHYERDQVEEAERWWRRAVDLGDAGAARSLGQVLADRGEDDEAERMYRLSADRGEIAALNDLGALHGERDRLDEAEDWYRRGAEAGDPTAAFNLGQYLLHRHDDSAGAERWLRVAAADGDESARRELTSLVEEYARNAVAVLREHGTDLEQPRRVEHYLYTETEDAARAIAAQAGDDFEAAVRPPGEDVEQWLVLVAHALVVDERAFAEARERLGEIAHEHGGDYDGWEAPTAP